MTLRGITVLLPCLTTSDEKVWRRDMLKALRMMAIIVNGKVTIKEDDYL